MKKTKSFLSIFVLFIIINMILFPTIYIQQTLDGISAWAFHVLPSILPFIFFTTLLTSLGSVEKISSKLQKPSYFLFKTPPISPFVFLTSIISGYPIGAKMTADLYQAGKISKLDAFKMCSFCSTSGPMFIVGAVGTSLLGNSQYGYVILISHIIGALINGILYRNLKIKENKILNNSDSSKLSSPHNIDLSTIILDSVLSVLSIGAIIAIFFVLITSISPILSFFPPSIASLLKGLIEITNGCTDIALTIKGSYGIIASTFVISFGGLSTILQSLTFLGKLKMPIKLFVLQKFTHAVCSTIISVILVALFL